MINSKSTSTLRQERPEGGFALIEVVIAGIVLAVSVLGSIHGIVYSTRLSEAKDEKARAILMARAMVERTMSVPFEEALAEFNADPTDDPAGLDTATGNVMTCSELLRSPGDAPPLTGIIEFPLDSAGVLVEKADRPEFGLPLDLNGDGETDDSDRRTDYRVLPMRIRVWWTGQDGVAKGIEFFTMLRRRS